MAFAITAIGALAGGALVGTTAGALTGAAIGATAAGGINSKNAAKSGTKAASAAADQQYAIAAREADLADKQYADQKKLTDEFMPIYRQQLQTNLAEQAKTTARGDAQWQSYVNDFQPLEHQLSQTALNYATPGRMEQAAQSAAGDVATQFDTARGSQRDALIASGADPSTIAALESAGRLEEAKATAGAKNTARLQTEQAGISLLDNAARFGRNMPSTGLQTATTALNQGNAAQGNMTGAMQSTAAPVQYSTPLYSASSNAYGQSANTAIAGAQLGLKANSQQMSMFGDLLGAGLKGYGMGMFGSSEEIKDIHGEVEMSLEHAGQILEGSPSKIYNYTGDHDIYVGPTAESMRDSTGLGDGKTIAGQNMLGLHHAMLGTVIKELRELKGGRGNQLRLEHAHKD